jgi:hypothetical protein
MIDVCIKRIPLDDHILAVRAAKAFLESYQDRRGILNGVSYVFTRPDGSEAWMYAYRTEKTVIVRG